MRFFILINLLIIFHCQVNYIDGTGIGGHAWGSPGGSGQITLSFVVDVPTGQPTSQPSRPTSQPTGQPSGQPTGQPSGHPTSSPSNKYLLTAAGVSSAFAESLSPSAKIAVIFFVILSVVVCMILAYLFIVVKLRKQKNAEYRRQAGLNTEALVDNENTGELIMTLFVLFCSFCAHLPLYQFYSISLLQFYSLKNFIEEDVHFKEYEVRGSNPLQGSNPLHSLQQHRLQQQKQKLQQQQHQQQQEELERRNAEEQYRTQYLAGRNSENLTPLRNTERNDELNLVNNEETGEILFFVFLFFILCFFHNLR